MRLVRSRRSPVGGGLIFDIDNTRVPRDSFGNDVGRELRGELIFGQLIGLFAISGPRHNQTVRRMGRSATG